MSRIQQPEHQVVGFAQVIHPRTGVGQDRKLDFSFRPVKAWASAIRSSSSAKVAHRDLHFSHDKCHQNMTKTFAPGAGLPRQPHHRAQAAQGAAVERHVAAVAPGHVAGDGQA